MSPIYATRPTAVSVSTPRRQRSRATVGAHGPWVDCSRIRASSRPRRASITSWWARYSPKQRLAEADLAQPSQMTLSPCLAGPRPDQPLAQQQLADPVTGAHQITAEILTGTHQVTQRLELRRCHQHRPQLARRVQLGELQRVAGVGLDLVTGLTRNCTRRADHHLNTRRTSCPRQPEPGRPSLIDPSHRPRKRLIASRFQHHLAGDASVRPHRGTEAVR